MDLPQSGYEYREVVDDLIHREIFIGKLLLLREIIVERRTQLRGAAIKHGRTIEHPFFLRHVVIPNAPGMRINAGKQLPVNGKILVRRKAEGTFGKKRGDPCGHLVGLLGAV